MRKKRNRLLGGSAAPYLPHPRHSCGRVGAVMNMPHGCVLTDGGDCCDCLALLPVAGRGDEDAAAIIHESKAVQLVGVPEDFEVPGHGFLSWC